MSAGEPGQRLELVPIRLQLPPHLADACPAYAKVLSHIHREAATGQI